MKYVPSEGFPVRVGDADGPVVKVVAKNTVDSDRPSDTQVLVADDGQEYVKSGPGVVQKKEDADLPEEPELSDEDKNAVPGDGSQDASASVNAEELAEADAKAKPAAKAKK